MAQYFNINGLIDTSNNVLDNINEITNASGCFLSWDQAQGKWNVIINTTGTSSKSFDDDNIIGEINLSGSGVNDLFNKVRITFPNKDTRDTVDVIEVSTPSADRLPQELDNTLELSTNIVNVPYQARYIASRELKQSRLDKIIEFRANFEANSVAAGDLIDVTNTTLGYTSKLFRVIQIDEADDDDGNLIFAIIAQEYDADVYSVQDLTYEYSSNENGIKSKVFNAEIDAKDDYADGVNIGRLLAANLGVGLLRSLFSSDDNTETVEQELQFANENTQALMEAGVSQPTLTHTAADTTLCSGSEITLSLGHDCEVCFFDQPTFAYEYSITGCTSAECSIPLTGTVDVTSTGSLTITFTVTTQKSITVTVGGASTVYDVMPEPDEYIQNVTATSSTITEGGSTTVNVTTVGKTDGDTLNYAITGSASSKVTTPSSLTGTVTVNSNAASLAITTSDDSAFNDAEDLIVTFTPAPSNYCSVTTNTTTITVNNNDTTGPEPDPDTTCDYQLVPTIWCGTWDGTTGYLKSVTAKAYQYLPIVSSGGTAVPKTISVTGANTSSAAISIDTTVQVDTTVDMGMNIDVITTFNAPGSGPYLSGTTTAVKGY